MTSVAVARGDAMAPASARSSLHLAWALVVLLTVPEIVLRSFLRIDTWWMLPARIVVIVLMLGLTFVSDAARPLRGMTIVFLVIYGVEAGLLLTVVPGTSIYASVVGRDDRIAFVAERLLRIGAVVVMLATLLVMGLRRREMYLAVGDLRAIAEPIGVPRTPEPWTKFGRNYALISVALILFFLVPAFGPSVERLSIPLVLFAAGCAALNAFAEEFLYRAALLPQVLGVFGKRATLLLVPGWFALAHWYGVPSGLTGVLLAFVGGWFFARAMIETRGIAWSWFLHFLADFAVYLVLLLAAAI